MQAGVIAVALEIKTEAAALETLMHRHEYPVESMLEYLAGGDTIEDLLAEFPDLEREDLLACLEFAAESLRLKTQHLALA